MGVLDKALNTIGDSGQRTKDAIGQKMGVLDKALINNDSHSLIKRAFSAQRNLNA
jgi:hypothetical protein